MQIELSDQQAQAMVQKLQREQQVWQRSIVENQAIIQGIIKAAQPQKQSRNTKKKARKKK